ncbi:hypothetical protein JTE90_010827 [Oedothorax gibbosus]|uniref:BRISC complex subunit Abro1 n=1 Tax=Oedothorax gibbosus TaxID=931172 RepID=A0AAV6V2R5_9ARAC|nr:hypothetical protein JTE90_010827 [Oedothorax gibbosus]
MAASVPKVHLSPFVLSTAMFDNANSSGDQEGFLIGNAQRLVRREISDSSSMYNTEEDLVISLYSCIPCGSYLSFYDRLGNLDEQKIKEFLGDRMKSVVGWYRYRRNFVAYPSSREMIVHKNLMTLFFGNISFGHEYFAFGVLGSAAYPTPATHTYDYAFFNYFEKNESNERYESFRSLNINLLNLGDTKTAYRSGSISGSYINSTTFNSVLEIPWDFNSCWQTEDVVQQMHKTLREKCDVLAEELAASESVNSGIEQEIKKLEEELGSLVVKEPVKTNNNEINKDNLENIPPEKISVPLSDQHAQLFKKRPIQDIIDLNEELHPIYGKFFPKNRTQGAGSSFHFSGEMTEINYNFLPPKKKLKVLLQERRRILDHDYEIGSDDNPQKRFVPETYEESASTYAYDSCDFLSSGASGFVQGEEVPNVSSRCNIKNDEPKVHVVYLDGRIVDDIVCPESVAEEIVETYDSECSTVPNSPSNISNTSQEHVPSPKISDDDETMKNNDSAVEKEKVKM